jgi:hypothetical protein
MKPRVDWPMAWRKFFMVLSFQGLNSSKSGLKNDEVGEEFVAIRGVLLFM